MFFFLPSWMVLKLSELNLIKGPCIPSLSHVQRGCSPFKNKERLEPYSGLFWSISRDWSVNEEVGSLFWCFKTIEGLFLAYPQRVWRPIVSLPMGPKAYSKPIQRVWKSILELSRGHWGLFWSYSDKTRGSVENSAKSLPVCRTSSLARPGKKLPDHTLISQ